MPLSKEIGVRLKNAREAANYTQAVLAKKLGIRRGTQIRYENGSRSPSSEYLANAARLGVDVTYVVTGQRTIEVEFALEECRTSFGITFKANAPPCQLPKEDCDTCEEDDEWCLWKIADIEDDTDENRTAVPEGNFPWSGMCYRDMCRKIAADSGATDRETALAETLEMQGEMTEEAWETTKNLRIQFARCLCRILHTPTPVWASPQSRPHSFGQNFHGDK